MPIILKPKQAGGDTGPAYPVLSANGRIITPASPEFGTCGFLDTNNAGRFTTGSWFSANDPCALMFTLSAPSTVMQLGWMNGTSAGGNVDIGIYDESWNRQVSAGTTVGSGNSVWQWSDVTDTPLNAGRYYIAYARDNTTANRTQWFNTANSLPLMGAVGLLDSATDAFPLPLVLTDMAVATSLTLLPVIAIAFREPF